MASTLSHADARAIERAARTVPGVAFAELSVPAGGQASLRLWVWHGSAPEEIAGHVEVALREMGVEVATGEVIVAGIARALPAGGPRDDEAVRVIDLGEGTWATEPVEPDVPPLLPPPDDALALGPTIGEVTVTRGRGACRVRVMVRGGDGSSFAGESGGADTDARVQRAVSEAAVTAAAAALGYGRIDVEHAGLAEVGTLCAVVVIRAAGSDRRAAGAAVVSGDPWHAFATAALHATLALP